MGPSTRTEILLNLTQRQRNLTLKTARKPRATRMHHLVRVPLVTYAPSSVAVPPLPCPRDTSICLFCQRRFGRIGCCRSESDITGETSTTCTVQKTFRCLNSAACLAIHEACLMFLDV